MVVAAGKLVLVHPAIASTTSPPLGVCTLKGHLRQALRRIVTPQ